MQPATLFIGPLTNSLKKLIFGRGTSHPIQGSRLLSWSSARMPPSVLVRVANDCAPYLRHFADVLQALARAAATQRRGYYALLTFTPCDAVAKNLYYVSVEMKAEFGNYQVTGTYSTEGFSNQLFDPKAAIKISSTFLVICLAQSRRPTLLGFFFPPSFVCFCWQTLSQLLQLLALA
jgi:hypothetical protein